MFSNVLWLIADQHAFLRRQSAGYGNIGAFNASGYFTAVRVRNLHYIAGNFALDGDFVVDALIVAVIFGKAFCNSCCVRKRDKRCVLNLYRVVRLFNQAAAAGICWGDNLSRNVSVLLAVQYAGTRGNDSVVRATLCDCKACGFEVVARVVEGDFVARRGRSVEQFRNFRCALRIGVLGYDNLCNRRCILHRAACVHFACGDFAGLSVPQALDTDCAIVVNFQRCADSKQHLCKVFAPCCDRQPSIQFDICNVGLHIAGQR